MLSEKNVNTLIQNYIKGESTSEELKDTLKLFEKPYQNLNLRTIIYDIWKEEIEIDGQSEIENSSGLLDKIHHRINLQQNIQVNKKSTKKILIYALKVAAILIIGLFLGLLMNQLKVEEPVYYTSIAPSGSVSQMILPDNTMVYLNSGSEIKYTINKESAVREVFLDGEAWFEVVKNTKKPFLVHTPFYDVKVYGTQFNVKAYNDDNEIATTLEEGSVEVLSSNNLKLKKSSLLQPGEQLVYNAQLKAMEIKEVDTRLFTSWKDNKLIFINMNLKELIVLLERKYGVNIMVDDDLVLDYHYDGTIKNETIIEVLDLLKETLPVRYKIDGQKIIIQNK